MGKPGCNNRSELCTSRTRAALVTQPRDEEERHHYHWGVGINVNRDVSFES